MNLRNLIGLMLLISFGSIGAVACTPALPQIAEYFGLTSDKAGECISWYLIGYTVGQLIYGPLINRYGSKITIGIGVGIEIIGSGLCILSAQLNQFDLLLSARIIMAIGAGSGLTLAFTIASKLASTKEQSARTISLLTIAFAITPGVGVFIGGWLLNYSTWTSSFYFMAGYGVLVLFMSWQLPEIIQNKNPQALQIKQLITNYWIQIQSGSTVLGGLLVGSATSIIYGFAELAPFIAMNLMHLNPSQYGVYNFIPVTGMLSGSLLANYLGKFLTTIRSLQLGLFLSGLGTLILAISLKVWHNLPLSLFGPMVVVYIGLALVFGNSSALALANTNDKGNASAILSFINMSSAVVVTSGILFIKIHNAEILPILFAIFIGLAILWFIFLTRLKLI